MAARRREAIRKAELGPDQLTPIDVWYINHLYKYPSMENRLLSAPRAVPATVSLESLDRGVCAVVHEVIGDSDDIRRLKAMGICAGRRLEVVKRGDPMILRVFGSRIGLSNRLAACVKVQPCNQLDCPREP